MPWCVCVLGAGWEILFSAEMGRADVWKGSSKFFPIVKPFKLGAQGGAGHASVLRDELQDYYSVQRYLFPAPPCTSGTANREQYIGAIWCPPHVLLVVE